MYVFSIKLQEKLILTEKNYQEVSDLISLLEILVMEEKVIYLVKILSLL